MTSIYLKGQANGKMSLNLFNIIFVKVVAMNWMMTILVTGKCFARVTDDRNTINADHEALIEVKGLLPLLSQFEILVLLSE